MENINTYSKLKDILHDYIQPYEGNYLHPYENREENGNIYLLLFFIILVVIILFILFNTVKYNYI